MKKTMLGLIVFASLLQAESLNKEKQKELMIKVLTPTLKITKKVKTCAVKATKEEFKNCMIATQKELLNEPLFKILNNGKSDTKIDYSLWKNEEKIKKLDEMITKSQKALDCIKNPQTSDINKCMLP